MGPKCHFAHGKEELREMNDPIPQGMQSMNRTPKQDWNFGGQQQQGGQSTHSNQNSGGTYKTAKCKFFEKGYCKYEQNCSFAHGDQDLRSPNSYSSPQGTSHINSAGPSQSSIITSQVAAKQIQQLSEHLGKYHATNFEILDKIKKANELNVTGNTQGAASLLYGIMSRMDRSEEDNENYAAIIYNIQQLGDSYYQQLQTKQFQQMSAPQMGGLNQIDTNQPFGGQSSNKQSYGQNQGFGGQIHKEYQIEDNSGYHNEESMGYGNSTGGYQAQGGYGGYNNYGGNQGSFGAGQGGYGQQQYDPTGHY
jgi:hypothetical protein